MSGDCIAWRDVPGVSELFRAFMDEPQHAALRSWYPTPQDAWMGKAPVLQAAHLTALADVLQSQAGHYGGSDAVIANIDKLRSGAAAVITGQQVGLLGGPLLTLLKAATAVARAAEATAATGREHVPVFWLATEDHDIDEVDTVSLSIKQHVETRSAEMARARIPGPVGQVPIDAKIEAVITWAEQALAFAPVTATLRSAYAEGVTLASAFARLIAALFAEQGLIVVDAAAREFHALGADVLRCAITHASELEQQLLARSEALTAAGFHAQVLVAAGHSLLFLITEKDGAAQRVPLMHSVQADGAVVWSARSQQFTQAQLLALLDEAPERLSPNALLRPVFQDAIFPAAAYIAGPAEVAYFAQSEVVYRAALGRVTPVLPRLSATLLEPAIAAVMDLHEVAVTDVWRAKTAEELAVRLGARAMPIEGKRRIAAAGNSLDSELTALTGYMTSLSEDLGRAAGVSASKMRYQMNRLRRMAARFELEKQTALAKQAHMLSTALYPNGHLQERVLAGVQFAAAAGDTLAQTLVRQAAGPCNGHQVIRL
jgi:bacillithiol biosynthesis cysteine-adding enzyme BshC